jgi:hypothetical protein
MKRNLSVLVVLVVGVAASVVGVASAEPPVAADETSSAVPMVEDASLVEVVEQAVADMVPLTPSRVLDTRTGLGVGGSGRVGAGGSIDLGVLGVGGVPVSGVAGVVFNLTATRASARTFVNAWPSGEVEPATSVLNVGAGEVFANLVVAKVGDGGRVSLSNAFGEVHLLADVVGWIPAESDLTTLTPARLLDTRSGVGVSSSGPVGAGGQVDLDVLGRGGVPASGVDSVVVNVTATRASQRSFVTLWPTGLERPTASVLNMVDAAPVPNLALAKVGDGGRISLFNRAGSAHLVVDVVGYTAAGSDVVAVAPQRLLDTRSGLGVEAGRVGREEFIDVTVVGVAGVPERGATAAIINVTAASPSERSFVTTWPTGLPRPEASSLNMLAGENVANLVVAPIGAGGKVRLSNAKGSTALIADVVGWVGVPDGVTAPVISEHVRVLDEDQVLEIEGDPASDGLVTIEVGPSAEVEVGSIIVSGPTALASSGLLRRVVSVEPQPGGPMRAQTRRAVIADAIPEGSISMSTAFDPDDLNEEFASSAGLDRGDASAVQGTSAIQSPLSCSDSGVSIATTFDGSIDPVLDLQFDWSPSGLHRAQVTAGLDLVVDVTATATAKVSCSLSTNLFTYNLSAIVIPVAGIPIVFLPELSVDLGLAGAVEGSVSGSAQYRVDTTAGFIYDENTGITEVKQATPSATAAWTAGAKASVDLSVTPSLSVYVFGVVGPKASVPFGVGVEVDPCRTPLWKLGGSVKAQFGLSLSSWLGSLTLANVDITLVDSPITQGGSAIPDFPGCDFTVEVERAGVGVQSIVEAGTAYKDPAGDFVVLENFQDGYFVDKGQRGVEGGRIIETVREAGDVSEADLGPYVPSTPLAVSLSRSAETPGASSSSITDASVGIQSSASEWRFDAVVEARAETNTLPDVNSDDFRFARNYNAYASAIAASTVTVVILQTSVLTVSGSCDVGLVRVQPRGELPRAEGCVSGLVLEPGRYDLRADVSSVIPFQEENGVRALESMVTFSLTPRQT